VRCLCFCQGCPYLWFKKKRRPAKALPAHVACPDWPRRRVRPSVRRHVPRPPTPLPSRSAPILRACALRPQIGEWVVGRRGSEGEQATILTGVGCRHLSHAALPRRKPRTKAREEARRARQVAARELPACLRHPTQPTNARRERGRAHSHLPSNSVVRVRSDCAASRLCRLRPPQATYIARRQIPPPPPSRSAALVGEGARGGGGGWI
jgi:hypothetical protein